MVVNWRQLRVIDIRLSDARCLELLGWLVVLKVVTQRSGPMAAANRVSYVDRFLEPRDPTLGKEATRFRRMAAIPFLVFSCFVSRLKSERG